MKNLCLPFSINHCEFGTSDHYHCCFEYTACVSHAKQRLLLLVTILTLILTVALSLKPSLL